MYRNCGKRTKGHPVTQRRLRLLDSGMNFAATPEKIELLLVRALPDSTEVVWVHEMTVLP